MMERLYLGSMNLKTRISPYMLMLYLTILSEIRLPTPQVPIFLEIG